MNLFTRLARSFSVTKPIIALLTDFGLRDHYVGTMKGVIHSINPFATVVDITHEVQSQHIRQAGFLVWAAYKFFPEKTIFVCVVDPGVGSKRRILGIQTAHHIFLAPDNMLLDFVLSEEKILQAIEVSTENNPYVLPKVSSTFHGRDVFAPVAAHLSRGVSLSEIGRPISIHPVMSPFVDIEREKTKKAEILHIDRFGNLITNIRAARQETARTIVKGLLVNKRKVRQWTKNYVDAPSRMPCLILGSSNLVEIVVKNGSAAQLLKADVGTALSIL